MFAITTPTKATLKDVRVLSQKNRMPADNPGIQLPMRIKVANGFLSLLDPALAPLLFTKNPTRARKGRTGRSHSTASRRSPT